MASNLATVTVHIDSNDPAVIARMQELIAENERFRRALEWYADEGNYRDVWKGDQLYKVADVDDDNGERAQRALEGKDYDTPHDNP
jgi:hypothetical protein